MFQYENNSNIEYEKWLLLIQHRPANPPRKTQQEGSNSLRPVLRYLIMASMSKATTKRKADTCGSVVADGGGKKPRSEVETPPPLPLHLPAPVWGRVLDYMPYQAVRSALLICKAIANEAVKCVHTLNIMRDCELDIPAARRFQNVKNVNILSLVMSERMVVSSIAARATVPFIQNFPRLSSIFVGGVTRHGGKVLYPGGRRVLIFRSLMSSFIGAYKTRALSQEISLSGVLDPISLYVTTDKCKSEREGETPPNECRFCRDACKHLPLKDCHFFETAYWCLDNETKEGILRGRKGGMNVIIWTQCADLVDGIGGKKDWHRLNHEIKIDREFHEKLVEMGLDDEMDGDPQYFSCEGLHVKEIDRLVESSGIIPRDIPKGLFYERMGLGTEGREFDVWCTCKSTVDSLIARGYPIHVDPNDLIIVDEAQEPALQRIIVSKRVSNRS